MPITIGGKISKISDIENRLKNRAEKSFFNQRLINNPKLVLKSAQEFGSQCIVASIDAKLEKMITMYIIAKTLIFIKLLVTELAQFAESLFQERYYLTLSIEMVKVLDMILIF